MYSKSVQVAFGFFSALSSEKIYSSALIKQCKSLCVFVFLHISVIFLSRPSEK